MLSPNRTRRSLSLRSALMRRQQIAHRNGTLNFRINQRGAMGEVCWSPNGWTVCCSYAGLANPICTQRELG